VWFEPSLEELREQMRLARTLRLGRDASQLLFDARYVEETRVRFRDEYSYGAIGQRLRAALSRSAP
jgi:hypothetical protein